MAGAGAGARNLLWAERVTLRPEFLYAAVIAVGIGPRSFLRYTDTRARDRRAEEGLQIGEGSPIFPGRILSQHPVLHSTLARRHHCHERHQRSLLTKEIVYHRARER